MTASISMADGGWRMAAWAVGAAGLLIATPVAGQGASTARDTLRLTLTQAIERAHGDGNTARAARASRDAARQRDRAFGASLLPQMSLGGSLPSYNRSISSLADASTGETRYVEQETNQASLNVGITQRLPFLGSDLSVTSAVSQLDQPLAPAPAPTRSWNSTPMRVSLRQDLLTASRWRWDVRAQELGAEVAERQYREAMEDVAIATTNAFFDYYNARLNLQNAINNAAVNDTLYQLNQGRYEVGRIGENDLLQSELALLRSQVSLETAQIDHDRTLAALRLALNLPPNAALDVVVRTEIPEVVVDTGSAVQQALRNRASMASLELQQLQADRRISEARFGSGLNATLQASMGYNRATSASLADAYKDLGDARSLSLAVSMPIFGFGNRSATIQAAKLDEEQAEYNARQTREQTVQEAHFAALQVAIARRQLTIAAKADTVGAKRFEVAKNRYVIGRIDIDNLYQAQSEKDSALQSYLNAVRGYWVAYYRLRRVTMYDFATGTLIR